MKKKQAVSHFCFSFRWFFCAIGLVACSYNPHAQRVSPAQAQRTQIATFTLSKVPQLRLRQRALLAKLDILGTPDAHNIYQAQVSLSELGELAEAGIEVTDTLPADKQKILDDAQIEKYKSAAQIEALLQEIAANQPDVAQIEVFGKSTEMRPLTALVLSQDVANSAHKPTIVFDGMHHAREIMTSEVVLDAAQNLAAGWKTDPTIKAWLQKFRLVFIPMVNPDGNERVRHLDPLWRKNAAVQNGEVVGVDLNRNYPETWNQCDGSSGDPGATVYRGPSEGSEPETQAMMALLERLKPMAGISYHSFGGQVLLPPGCANSLNDDSNLYYDLAYAVRNGITDDKGRKGTYVVGRSSDILYPVDGTFMEWAWKKWGTYALTLELGSNGFLPNYDTWRDLSVKRQQGSWQALLSYAESHLVELDFAPDLMSSQNVLCDAAVQKRLSPEGHLATLLPPGDYNCSFTNDGWQTYQSYDFSVPAGGKNFGRVTRADTQSKATDNRPTKNSR